MRPVEFTDQQIINAGLELVAAGRTVTGFALRQRIGGGTPNRLRAVWDEYKSSQAVAAIEPVAELPIEVAQEVEAVTKALAEKIALLAVELNDKAVKAAERRVSDVVRATGEQRAQAERELADASDTVNDLERQIDEQLESFMEQSALLDAARGLAQTQAIELAQLREKLSSTEQNAKLDANRFKEQLEKLNSEKQELGEHSKQIEARLDSANVEIAQMQERLKAAEQTAKANEQKFKAEKQELIEQLERNSDRLDEARSELSDKNAAVSHQEKTIQELENRLTQLKAEQAGQLKIIGDELQNAKKETSEARELFARASGQLEAVNSQNATLLLAVQNKSVS